MRNQWLYELVNRVPSITNDQIAKMRHIEPVVKIPNSVFYQRIEGADKLHPRDVSCIWDRKPIGDPFTFHTLDITEIITQHHGGVFFKPSLAEVYAWILLYMPTEWTRVRYFCLGEASRIGSSMDIVCHCQIMGGKMLVSGGVEMVDGLESHRLIESEQLK